MIRTLKQAALEKLELEPGKQYLRVHALTLVKLLSAIELAEYVAKSESNVRDMHLDALRDALEDIDDS